jgi:GNAT superfamily N-acetyltransferase
MDGELSTRRLAPADAPALVLLRRQALENEPLVFLSSPEDDRLSLEFARTALGDREEQAVFGTCDGGDLVGMVGLLREPRAKQRHRASLWGMYVSPRARGRGAGAALVNAAVRLARDWNVDQLRLGVTTAAEGAKRLYERAGFRSWGLEPRALDWQGRFVDEHHLVLDLREQRSSQ